MSKYRYTINVMDEVTQMSQYCDIIINSNRLDKISNEELGKKFRFKLKQLKRNLDKQINPKTV